MTLQITPILSQFVSSAVANNIAEEVLPAWKPGKIYSVGEKVISGTSAYICASAGKSGATNPTHISGIGSDGNQNWIFMEALNTQTFDSNLYIGLGNTTEDFVLTDANEKTAFDSIIALKFLTSFNTRMGFKRNDWTSGHVYPQYNPSVHNDDVIVVHDLQVFKCLDNNGGASSTFPPTNNGTSTFRTADGYVWKFISELNSADVDRFATLAHYPISLARSSAIPRQFAVRNAAKPQSISRFDLLGSYGVFDTEVEVNVVGDGSDCLADSNITLDTVTQLYTKTPGTGYTQGIALARLKNSSGIGASATAIITNGAISSFNIVTAGDGYTDAIVIVVGTKADGEKFSQSFAPTIVANKIQSISVSGSYTYYSTAEVYIIPGRAAAIGYGVLAPYKGHGHNVINEARANAILISVEVKDADEYFLTGESNKLNQLYLITDVINPADQICTDQNLIGVKHPEYQQANTLKRFKVGQILVKTDIDIIRSAGQAENIKLTLA